MVSSSLSLVLLVNCIFMSVTSTVWEMSSKREFDLTRNRRVSIIPMERPSCVSKEMEPSSHVNTTDRLRRLRFGMRNREFDAYIIPNTDEHQSEDLAEYDKRVQYISGFTGSGGMAVVLSDTAILQTDETYLLLAETQLDCNWLIIEEHTIIWLRNKLANGSRIGVDRRFISWDKWSAWRSELSTKGIRLVGDQQNLVDEIWTIAQGRPYEVVDTIYIHDLKYAGRSWEQKVQDARNKLLEENIDSIVVTELDTIAWLFNLRGSDFPYTPVFKAFAFISQEHIRLYVHLGKLSWEVKNHLKSENCNSNDCVQLRSYNTVYIDLDVILRTVGSISIPSHASYSIHNVIPESKLRLKSSPIEEMKSIKNPTEIKGMKNAHIRDAVAIIDFLALLDKEVKEGKIWDEINASKKLTAYRREQELNKGESFSTISAYGSNAAIIHYRPLAISNKKIGLKNIYLLDSGGQYLDGTTDITRTVHFGNPDQFVKEVYTRILMGVIDVMTTVFPEGEHAYFLEPVARRYLYQKGLDYMHGTSHGIGAFLNVHEYEVFKPGTFISNEPGYYEAGKFGIRLETTMMIKEIPVQHNLYGKKYYGFESIAFIPFEPNLILTSMLSDQQIAWLNDYNTRTRQIIGKELIRQERHTAFEWLMERTKYIEHSKCKNAATSITWSIRYLYCYIYIFLLTIQSSKLLKL